MMFCMRTTVNIDSHLLAEAKIEAARTHRSLGAVIDDALRVLLVEHASHIERESFSLPTDGRSGLRPGIDLEDKEQLADLLGDNLPNHAAP
jgi:hypothetical protein